jgi:hypothetical protein
MEKHHDQGRGEKIPRYGGAKNNPYSTERQEISARLWPPCHLRAFSGKRHHNSQREGTRDNLLTMWLLNEPVVMRKCSLSPPLFFSAWRVGNDNGKPAWWKLSTKLSLEKKKRD